MSFLFSRSQKKDIRTEFDVAAERARIQAAIDRALQMPESEPPQRREVKEMSPIERVNENAA